MGNPAQDIASQIKQNAVKVAQTLVQEPFEVLKTAGNQVLSGSEKSSSAKPSPASSFLDVSENGFSEEERKRQNQIDMSRLRELEAELKQVRIEKVVRELQEKIANGEVVYLEEYPEIPVEQKQVLKAQMEAIAKRREEEVKAQAGQAVSEPSSRPSRRLFSFGGSKRHAEDLQKSRETRMPPSG
jgi:transcription elongation GreA/GreB family factor